MKWGYILAQKLEDDRSKSFAVPFHCQPRPSGISLQSTELENIPSFPANRAEVGQNHDASNADSAHLSLLK